MVVGEMTGQGGDGGSGAVVVVTWLCEAIVGVRTH